MIYLQTSAIKLLDNHPVTCLVTAPQWPEYTQNLSNFLKKKKFNMPLMESQQIFNGKSGTYGRTTELRSIFGGNLSLLCQEISFLCTPIYSHPIEVWLSVHYVHYVPREGWMSVCTSSWQTYDEPGHRGKGVWDGLQPPHSPAQRDRRLKTSEYVIYD